MKTTPEIREAAARAVRAQVRIGPLGPNASSILADGGPTSLTPTEAEAAVDVVLDVLAAAQSEVTQPGLAPVGAPMPEMPQEMVGLLFGDLDPLDDGLWTTRHAMIRRWLADRDAALAATQRPGATPASETARSDLVRRALRAADSIEESEGGQCHHDDVADCDRWIEVWSDGEEFTIEDLRTLATLAAG